MTSLMFAEAGEAAEMVARQRAANAGAVADLAAQLQRSPPVAVTTVARGSSDHAATYARHLIETRAGLVTASVPPSTASVYGVAMRQAGMLCLAISQSGASPDLIAAVEAASETGALTVAMVNAAPSPLAGIAELVLPLHAGPEKSVAATKSYIAALAGSADLVAAWTGDAELSEALDSLREQLAQAWQADWSPMIEALRNARSLYVVGRGPSFGIAQEAALKFKETCGIHAEAFSGAELKHGPMALVGPDMPLLVFRSDDESRPAIDALAAEAAARGAPVLVTGEALPLAAAHPAVQPILAVQSFYRAVEALARARGRDPDHPPHLNKVTQTI
jgi:glucosamine--fructose-6-phosphate aminotransferase (isomerizing)